MRWFKHMTAMLEDPWVQDIFMAEHGIQGYGFLCGIYEIYAKECGENPGSWVTIPMANVTRKLRVSSAKVQRWLNDCLTAGKLSFEISLRQLRIKIPKMAELTDEWTARKKEKLGSYSGVTPSKNTEEEPEQETEQEHTARVCDFSKFIEKAHKYLLDSENANLGSTNWVKGFLKKQFEALKVDRPDLKPEEIVYCWQLACDTSSSKGAGSPEYYKKAFAGRIKDFKGIQTDYGKPTEKKKSDSERFLEALETGKYFYYKGNGKIYSSDELVFMPGPSPMLLIEPLNLPVGIGLFDIIRDPPPESLS